jgi:hypothetical protein
MEARRNKIVDLQIEKLRLLGKEEQALEIERSRIIKEIEEQYINPEVIVKLQNEIWDLGDAANNAASGLSSVIEELQKFHTDLLSGAQSSLGIREQGLAARSEFLQMSQMARKGDVEAIDDLPSYATAYLDAARAAGFDYADAFRLVQREINQTIGQYSFDGGGTVSGPASGYTIPTTFHGIEHIVTDSNMGEVVNVLTEVKGLLTEIRNTDGNINLKTIRIERMLDRVIQGGTEVRTTEVA